MKIYISTTAIKGLNLENSILELIKRGVTNIELTGGFRFSDFNLDKLVKIKNKYGLSIICHNYFPPPKEDFIINLGSLDNKIYNKSIKFIKKSIDISSAMGSKKYACHSGFFMDFNLSQLGKKISKLNLYDRDESIARFKNAQKELNEYGLQNGVKIYYENNVISHANYNSYNKINPFMFTDIHNMNDSILESSKILIDFAHLKVSCNTLQLDFTSMSKDFASLTDYWHLSDNNGISDLNLPLDFNSKWLSKLKEELSENLTVTLEIKGGIQKAIDSLNYLNKIYESK